MFLDARLGNTPQWFLDRPKDWAMRIPEVFRKCVVFLGRVIRKGSQEEPVFGGTGFFVTVPSGIHGLKYIYLVTAQHNLEHLALGDWIVRMNAKDGQFFDVRATKDHKWWLHPTEKDSVDVAVTQIDIPEFVDCNVIPDRLFLDDNIINEFGVGAGDEVYVTGLFTKARGRSRNLPIARTGNIALIPDSGELIPVKMGDRKVDAETYLIESRSIGGLSGSPAFVRATVAQKIMVQLASGSQREMVCTLPGDFFLFGLVHGHWEVLSEDKNEYNPSMYGKQEGSVNLGIAVVVPAKKIKEVIYHPELVQQRQNAIRSTVKVRGLPRRIRAVLLRRLRMCRLNAWLPRRLLLKRYPLCGRNCAELRRTAA